MAAVSLHHGDCRDVLRNLADCSVDSIVTDPPYELGFMGKKWDASGIAYDLTLWRETLRVLKPGGHLLAFGGTRTYHRMAVAIEDAGFEIRDSIHWLYGSGFPKSLDVSKAIDKAAGVERAREEPQRRLQASASIVSSGFGKDGWSPQVKTPATDAARQWEGWGTALKPAHEPIVVARKPLAGTVAANVLQHGTGALNIDGCRVGSTGGGTQCGNRDRYGKCLGHANAGKSTSGQTVHGHATATALGRWPANLVLTHAAECTDTCAPDCPVALLDGQSDEVSRFFTVTDWDPIADVVPFRYVAKPGKKERDAGLEELPTRARPTMGNGIGGQPDQQRANNRNIHPTVKPLALMRWLVRLVTPTGGTVLEPFAGSGTTLAAAVLEGFDAVGIELTADYLPIIEARIAWAHTQAAAPTAPDIPDGQLPLFAA